MENLAELNTFVKALGIKHRCQGCHNVVDASELCRFLAVLWHPTVSQQSCQTAKRQQTCLKMRIKPKSTGCSSCFTLKFLFWGTPFLDKAISTARRNSAARHGTSSHQGGRQLWQSAAQDEQQGRTHLLGTRTAGHRSAISSYCHGRRLEVSKASVQVESKGKVQFLLRVPLPRLPETACAVVPFVTCIFRMQIQIALLVPDSIIKLYPHCIIISYCYQYITTMIANIMCIH